MSAMDRRRGGLPALASPWRDAVWLVLLITALRVPFFFRAVINWDESSQILMGQSLVDGHLPYMELWDNKPPLAFAFYAVPIALFGRSLLAVRLAGAVCVVVAALLAHRIGTRLWTPRVGLLGAIWFAFLASVLEGHNVTTEHVALVPLLGVLALLLSRGLTPPALLAAGAMMGIASLVRLNLAYTGALLGAFLVLRSVLDRMSRKTAILGMIAYGSGIALMVLATLLPYVATGSAQVWLSSVILAPLAYSDDMSAMQALVLHGSHLVHGRTSTMALSALTWVGGIVGGVCVAVRWTRTDATTRRQLALYFVFVCGTVVSVLKSGAVAQHYLIQLAPFMALLAAIPMDFLLSGRFRVLATVGLMGALLLSMSPILLESRLLTTRALSGQSLGYGAAYDIAAFLRERNLSRERMYLMDDHVAYWFLDAKPISKITTHPSNIVREHLFASVIAPGATTESEMAYVLGQKPGIIVRKPSVWYLQKKPAARALLDESLRRDYELAAEIDGRLVYVRKR